MSRTIVKRTIKITDKVTQIIDVAEDTAKLQDLMVGSLSDAEQEIIEAFGLLTKGMEYAGQEYGARVDCAKGDNEWRDWSDRQIELIDALGQFKKEYKPFYNFVINLSRVVYDMDEAARIHSLSKEKIMEVYVAVLNQWCIMRGMGDQLK